MPSPIVVFDTNVLIPLIIPASRSTRCLFSRLEAAGWSLAISPQILEEVRDKMLNREPLRRWLESSTEEIQEFLDKLPTVARLIPWKRKSGSGSAG